MDYAIQMITHMRQGHQNATLRCKDGGFYGSYLLNCSGVLQRSATGSLLIMSYIGGMVRE